MKRITTATIILLALAIWPPASKAQESVTYTWTAPTTGGPVWGYTVYRNTGNGTWTVAVDSTQTRSYSYSQPAGSSHQIKVAAFNRGVTPIMSGELVIGQAVSSRRYGPDSPFSVPNTVDIAAPGGCGRPSKQ